MRVCCFFSKFQLEDTENLEERREIRKQLRELRNRKFEEEIKKVTANDYRPGRTKSALSNGVDSSLSSVGRKESVEKKVDEEDVHGINHLETEEELQALVNMIFLPNYEFYSRPADD